MPTTRAHRLPAATRRAVSAMEAAFCGGSDQQYTDAVERLRRECTGLSVAQLGTVNAELAAVHARINGAALLRVVTAALRTGRYRTLRRLPGGVDVLQVDGGDLDQLLVTVPAALDSDPPPVRALVHDARAAVLAGSCPRCRAQLTVQGAEQLTLTHASSCPLSDRALARARRP